MGSTLAAAVKPNATSFSQFILRVGLTLRCIDTFVLNSDSGEGVSLIDVMF